MSVRRSYGVWVGLLAVWLVGCGEESSVTPSETESVEEDTSGPQQIEEMDNDATGESDGVEETEAGEGSEVGSIVINEIVAKASDDGPDWVELYNPSDAPVELGDFRIQDENDESLYLIPEGVVLESGDFLVIEGKNSEAELAFSFGLGSADAVRLSNASGDLVD